MSDDVEQDDEKKESLIPERDEEAKAVTKAATDRVRELPEEAVEDRVVRLAFGGDRARWEQFVAALKEALPPTVTVVIRGSAVIGRKWMTGDCFDADGPGTSDLDLTLVGDAVIGMFTVTGFFVPGMHSRPLSDDDPDIAPDLIPLRETLMAMTDRPVNIQASRDVVMRLRGDVLNQPYLTIIDKT